MVDLPTMKMLLPNVCAGGDVVRAQVVGHFDKPGPAARAEVVIDATTLPARQVFWRDLRYWGPGYPLEWLGEEGDGASKHEEKHAITWHDSWQSIGINQERVTSWPARAARNW